ncbi:MAG: hypothetical protein IPJ84_21120 [Bdellovibrionales bacterium]|nr:hypothetical protein [Bdellovibrionales bacterium]
MTTLWASIAIALSLSVFVPAAQAYELTLEADALSPLLRATDRTGVKQLWFSAGSFIDDHFIIRLEYFQQSGTDFGTGSSQTGGGSQIGSQDVSTSMLGLSGGLCYPSCNQHSWRVRLGVGRAEREFSDSIMGRELSVGRIWFTEIGYQWRWGNAMTGLSIASLNSDLKEAVRFDTATAHLEISKRNSEQLLKWNVGVAF